MQSINFFKSTSKFFYYFFIILFIAIQSLHSQQINISRIESMPNLPEPYRIRDWKAVTMGYDSLVFDYNATGHEYLPLIWTDGNTINYPEHNRFGLHTVVGTPYKYSAEAINVLPAVIGATLVGIDKSNQNGYDFVLMCEEWFNHRPEEYVYLNGFVSSSGSDWWYDTMPNVFFYQLYDLYPSTGDFNYQFIMVADRWLEAVQKMGGDTRPWQQPYMNYRAWILSTMQPLTEGVREPEAAGAITWLLYNAYVKTGLDKYRIGAEWSMEFLNSKTSNPSYELQLPYGVYCAARMNAELGTNYNIQKLLNWCFTPEGNVRQWGATLGNWGGYDCDGLIGEALYEGYAFAMNGFEQIGALVPMVRYDDRFARAIGKWVLNCANASRLFYTNYLPDENQDSEEWAHVYDPKSYIAHESMREKALYTGISPYATGDAIRGGWGETNLALYGSSHVGILGGIIDTTNVSRILCLDVRKTDYFSEDGYPSYLYFNPYMEEKIVEIDVGQESRDLYDAVSNEFLIQNVNGLTSFMIPADQAVLLIVVPANGTISYDLNKMLINNIVVDYNSAQSVSNYPPRIKSLDSDKYKIMNNDSTIIYCTAEDKDSQNLNYVWSANGGSFSQSRSQVWWKAPEEIGYYQITCIVDDEQGGQDSSSIALEVTDDNPPTISKMSAASSEISPGEVTELTCTASDIDGDTLIYNWFSAFGVIVGEDSQVQWTAPDSVGFYYISCLVDDQRGGADIDSIAVTVGHLILDLPLDGNAQDQSGFNNHGVIHGAIPSNDRFGEPNKAYYFDGIDDYIQVATNPALNFQHGITVHFWMKASELPSTREAYPLSHGNWENRWKISITNEGIRWTVKTTIGIKDLDSETKLQLDKYFCITCVYDKKDFLIYINGQLDASSTYVGTILTTNIDLTIGQVLPNNSGYNFQGVIDEVRVYNSALSATEIKQLYDQSTPIREISAHSIPKITQLTQNYPNPFNNWTDIRYQINRSEKISIKIFNTLGQEIKKLYEGQQVPGYYKILWDGTNEAGNNVTTGLYICELKTQKLLQKIKIIYLK